MSILIKGMEIPKDCYECPLMMSVFVFKCDSNMCSITKGGCIINSRPPHCPLVEVPKHGLIDKQMLLRNIADNQFANPSVGHEEDYAFWGKVWDYINDAPTIIEAEEGE